MAEVRSSCGVALAVVPVPIADNGDGTYTGAYTLPSALLEAAVAAIKPEPATRKRPAIAGVTRSKFRNLRRRVNKLERHLLALRGDYGVDTPSR